MTTKLDSVSIVGMRTTHFNQLLNYVAHWEESEMYYGNKAQFEKRHAEITTWLENIIIQAENPNNKIPKHKEIK